MGKLNSLIKFFLITLLTITTYYLINKFQIYFLKGLKVQSSENLLASFVYLPHGLRVIVVYIFGSYSFIGLLLAHIIAGVNGINDINFFILTAALFSTISPFAAVYLVFNKFKIQLKEIKLKNILVVAIISAILNSFFSVSTRLLFDFYQTKEVFSFQFFQFFIGDILGVLFLFLFIILFINLKKIIIK